MNDTPSTHDESTAHESTIRGETVSTTAPLTEEEQSVLADSFEEIPQADRFAKYLSGHIPNLHNGNPGTTAEKVIEVIVEKVGPLSNDEINTLISAFSKTVLGEKVEMDAVEEYLRGANEDVEDSTTDSRLDTIPVKSLDGTYAKRVRDGNEYRWDTIANFVIDAERFLWVDEDELHVELIVSPSNSIDGDYNVTVPLDVFNNVQKFRDEVCIGRTTRFDGDQSDLNDIRERIGLQDAPELAGTHQMGIHEENLVLQDGVLSTYGWVDEPNHIYVSRNLEQERKVALSSDMTECDEDEVAAIIELLSQMREPERFIPVLGWFYAVGFKPRIMDKEGDFNILNVWGETGSGKSKSLKTVWNTFGMGDGNGPLKAKGTTFPIMAAMSLSNTLPMWFDEFKPSDMSSQAEKDVMDLLRNVTVGGTASRGNPDLSSEMYHLRAPVVVSGEQGITGPAEGRRLIKTMFRKDTVDNDECVRAFKRLTGSTFRNEDGDLVDPDGYDLDQHALAYWQWVLGIEDEEFSAFWMSCKQHVDTLLDGRPAAEELDELHVQGLQTVRFGISMMLSFAEEMGADSSVLPGDEEVDDALLYLVDQISQTGSESHLDQFLSLAARAAAHGDLEDGEQYKWVHFDGPKEELRINIDLAHDMLGRYRREHNVQGIDWLTNVNDYKARIREAADASDSYVVTTGESSLGRPTHGINRAVGFNARLASERIEGFERSMFLEGEDMDVEHNVVEAAEPISSVAEGYTHVTVEVISTESPDSSSIAQAGTVRDATGTVDFTTWVKDTADSPKLEEQQCYVLKDVAVQQFQGAKKLSLQPGVTEVTEIQQGEGHTAYTDEGADTEMVADGGDISQEERYEAFWDEFDAHATDGEITVGSLAAHLADCGLSPDEVEQMVEKLVDRGDLSKHSGDVIRSER